MDERIHAGTGVLEDVIHNVPCDELAAHDTVKACCENDARDAFFQRVFNYFTIGCVRQGDVENRDKVVVLTAVDGGHGVGVGGFPFHVEAEVFPDSSMEHGREELAVFNE